MPKRFWIDGIQPLVGDIPEELAKRIAHRPWVDVTMLDWTMIGHPASIRGYIDPNAFRYYLPSLLVGGLASGMSFASGKEAPNYRKVVAGVLDCFL
jgi:hypothetical protein